MKKREYIELACVGVEKGQPPFCLSIFCCTNLYKIIVTLKSELQRARSNINTLILLLLFPWCSDILSALFFEKYHAPTLPTMGVNWWSHRCPLKFFSLPGQCSREYCTLVPLPPRACVYSCFLAHRGTRAPHSHVTECPTRRYPISLALGICTRTTLATIINNQKRSPSLIDV